MSERVVRTLAVIVSGVDGQGVGQGAETEHGTEHGFRFAEPAVADEQSVAGEERGVVGGSETHGIGCVTRCCETFDEARAERQMFAVVQLPSAREAGCGGDADGSGKEAPHFVDSGNMVTVRMRQQNIAWCRGMRERFDGAADCGNIAAGIDDQGIGTADEKV